MVMVYVVVVDCNDPENASILTHANGKTKVYQSYHDVSEVVKKINSGESDVVARAVVL